MIRKLLPIMLLLTTTAVAQDAEYRTHKVKLKVGGELTFEAPKSWGNRPEVEHGDAATALRFTPAGTRREPIFQVSMTIGVPEEPPTAETVRQVAEAIREQFRDTALETDIPISDRTDTKNAISYFTITDKEIKPREYQYLTTAVVSDGKAIVSSYFFSNDGAPDYAADAMHLLESLSFVPKEKKRKKKGKPRQ